MFCHYLFLTLPLNVQELAAKFEEEFFSKKKKPNDNDYQNIEDEDDDEGDVVMKFEENSIQGGHIMRNDF